MCQCVNCECEHCGSQNPDKLVGTAAAEAGLTSYDAEWWCDETCDCCSK